MARSVRRPANRARKPGWVVHTRAYQKAIEAILPQVVLRGPRSHHLQPHFGRPNSGADRYGRVRPWRQISIGQWADLQAMHQQMLKFYAYITSGARSALSAPWLQLSKQSQDVILVMATPRELGLAEPASILQLLEGAFDAGLMLCSQEIVAALYLNAFHWKVDECTISLPCLEARGGKVVNLFGISKASGSSKLLLNCCLMHLTTRVAADHPFIFILPDDHYCPAGPVLQCAALPGQVLNPSRHE